MARCPNNGIQRHTTWYREGELFHSQFGGWNTSQELSDRPNRLCLIVQLKKAMEDSFLGLIKENPGSKWPKTTLGCLRDNKRLSVPDLKTLHRICRSVMPPVLSR